MVLVHIESVEQLFDVFLLGDDDLSSKRVPNNGYLLKQLHEILELHVSFVFSENQPPKSGLFEIRSLEYDIQIVDIVIGGDLSIVVVVDKVEYSTDEAILSSQQPQSSSELLIVHSLLVVAELIESFADGLYLRVGKLVLPLRNQTSGLGSVEFVVVLLVEKLLLA